MKNVLYFFIITFILSQMTNCLLAHTPSTMDYVFSALSDSTRRDILQRLTKNSLTVSQIADSYPFALPTISKHIAVLERAQLVKKNKVGREYHVCFTPHALQSVSQYLSFYKKFWTKQVSNLEKFLTES